MITMVSGEIWLFISNSLIFLRQIFCRLASLNKTVNSNSGSLKYASLCNKYLQKIIRAFKLKNYYVKYTLKRKQFQDINEKKTGVFCSHFVILVTLKSSYLPCDKKNTQTVPTYGSTRGAS